MGGYSRENSVRGHSVRGGADIGFHVGDPCDASQRALGSSSGQAQGRKTFGAEPVCVESKGVNSPIRPRAPKLFFMKFRGPKALSDIQGHGWAAHPLAQA